MPTMTKLVQVVLVLIALLHLARLVYRVDVTVDGMAIPLWVSVVAVVGFAGLAIGIWREHRSAPPEH